MASILKVDTIQDQAGNNIINESANTITIGASGDTITIPSGATFASVGIDDNATSTAITISSAEEVTFTEDILLGDGKKAIFGAGSDLQIYHSGTNSIIDALGTGNLLIRSDGSAISLQVNSKNNIRAVSDAEVELYYNNNLKFEITSTGIDVTGEVLADKAYIAESTLTDGATINWDMSTQSVCKVTLGGNRTLAAPTNGSTGQFASILVIQDGTGSRTLTWNAVYEFASDTAPTLSTTGGKADLFVFRYNGTKWLEVGRNLLLTVS